MFFEALTTTASYLFSIDFFFSKEFIGALIGAGAAYFAAIKTVDRAEEKTKIKSPKVKICWGQGSPYSITVPWESGPLHTYLRLKITNFGLTSAMQYSVYVRKITVDNQQNGENAEIDDNAYVLYWSKLGPKPIRLPPNVPHYVDVFQWKQDDKKIYLKTCGMSVIHQNLFESIDEPKKFTLEFVIAAENHESLVKKLSCLWDPNTATLKWC